MQTIQRPPTFSLLEQRPLFQVRQWIQILRQWLQRKLFADQFFNRDASLEIDRLTLEIERLRGGRA